MTDADLRRIAAKLDADLAWRGPTDKQMSLVVLSRADAVVVRALIREKLEDT